MHRADVSLSKYLNALPAFQYQPSQCLHFFPQTCAYRILASALTDLNKRGLNDEFATKYYVLNPKSVTMGQLYGQVSMHLKWHARFW